MRFAPIVQRIKDQCPSFAHVDHILTSAASYDLPAALVSPVRINGVQPRINHPGAFAQDYTATVGVYVVIERRQNGLGDLGGAEAFDALCAELKKALVNWTAPDAVEPGSYLGGEIAPYEPGVVAWREDFAFTFEMRLT